MLKDTLDLGKDRFRSFREIDTWCEITFNKEDQHRLSQIDDVVDVSEHSMTFDISGGNHCIIPSQYILYAIFIKEYAIALRQHLLLFDQYKHGKNQNDIGISLKNESIDSSTLYIDEWSKTVLFRPLTSEEHNFSAKSIVNGHLGNYTIRQTADFFTSVILKIINVPDSSSNILGRLIYSLTSDIELYNYIEKRFVSNLPFIIKEKNANKFALRIFTYLFQYDDLNRFDPFMVLNRDTRYLSIKHDEYSLTSIFRISDKVQTAEDLSRGGEPRFFFEPIHLDSDKNYYYFSTEWTNATNSRLDISTLATLIERHYSEFELAYEEDFFFFRPRSTPNVSEVDLNLIQQINKDTKSSGLIFSSVLLSRFTASLLAKPFVILTGLSGSGKTKLAQAFASWICENEDQYRIVPVGADWTNREPLLGFPNALNADDYVKPDSGVLQLLIQARNNPSLPHFLILDEMNLSHVERYFADFLSAMESKDAISLHSSENDLGEVPPKFTMPNNLFIIGTVNIDETTNMFSPKVLDRANTIEFRVTESEMESFLSDIKGIDLSELRGKGSNISVSFVEMAKSSVKLDNPETINAALIKFFGELRKVGAEFGYRTAAEIHRLIHHLGTLDPELSDNRKIDIAIMQKLLPKLHGSRKKMCPVLETLGRFCVTDVSNIVKDVFDNQDYDYNKESVLYPLSLEKIARMYRGAIDNGFTSFAEA